MMKIFQHFLGVSTGLIGITLPLSTAMAPAFSQSMSEAMLAPVAAPRLVQTSSAPFVSSPVQDPSGSFPTQADWQSDYRLGPGDTIQINVFGAEEYGGEFLLLQDGTINLQQVGRVPLQGLTFQQAADAISAQYRVYIRNPLVTVTPVRLRPIRVAISGEVNRPGAYTIENRDTDNDGSNLLDSRFATLTQALSQAGGITAEADLRDVTIRRRTGPNRFETATINLWDLIQSGDLAQDPILQSGDEVVVPTAAALTPAELARISDANFAPDTINVYVAGEVDRPGMLEVPLNTPLNEAILNAGSFNPRANEGVVELVRLNPDGTATQRDIPIDFSQGINEENNPILKDRDVIVVKRTGVARVGDATNILLSPFTQILNTILGVRALFR